MTTHGGSCHCGNIQFEIDADVDVATRCNCSFCRRRGALLHGVAPENFRLLKGVFGSPNGVSKYGSELFDHYFCPNCGIQCFTQRKGEGEYDPKVILNLGCFDPTLSEKVEVNYFDGASLL